VRCVEDFGFSNCSDYELWFRFIELFLNTIVWFNLCFSFVGFMLSRKKKFGMRLKFELNVILTEIHIL